jgi:protoporphyrinogen oxidase
VKIAVLGGGLAGLTCAILLQEKGLEVEVFEQEEQPGGLARSIVKDGFVFDLHGGHVYNSKQAAVNDWVFSKLPKNNWQWQPRKARILYENNILDYPFELSLKKLPVAEAIDCVKGLISRQGSEPGNYYDWLIWNFGRAIAERYMLPYNEKIWSYDLRQLGTYWVKGKMPLVTIDEVLKAILTGETGEDNMPHSRFYYPLSGGIQTLANALAREVKTLHCGRPVISLEKTGQGWLVNGTDKFDRIVSTLPLKELPRLMAGALPSQVVQAIEALKFNSLTVTLCESAEPFDCSWLYIPSKTFKSHRIVFQGNFARNNCPAGKNSLAVETIGAWDPAVQTAELRREAWYNKIQVGGIIASSFTKYAYMIFDQKTPGNLKIISEYFAGSDLQLLGRFAEWQYYNMDICMKRAFEVAEGIK